MEKKILIVKSSSLGDILQSFIVVEYLHERFPTAKIDWIVEKDYESLVQAHPYIHKVFGLQLKGGSSNFFSFFKTVIALRKNAYDWVFDLQGNCKSALFTFLSRGQKKIGFGRKSVREWPNLLVTQEQYDPDLTQNMCLQYLQVVQQFLKDESPYSPHGVVLNVAQQEERDYCAKLASEKASLRILVSTASRWDNKKVSPLIWRAFLEKMNKEYTPIFYFIWGNEEEKKEACLLASFFENSEVVEKLSFPALQLFLSKMDLFLGVDSAALHLSATLPSLPTFSFFGPTKASIFQPEGENHLSFQGTCPWRHVFTKSCPYLRTCKSGDCLKNISAQKIEEMFSQCKMLLKKKSL